MSMASAIQQRVASGIQRLAGRAPQANAAAEENPQQGLFGAALVGSIATIPGALVGGGAGIYGAYRIYSYLQSAGSDPALAIIAGLVSGVILTPIGAQIGAAITGLIGAAIGGAVSRK